MKCKKLKKCSIGAFSAVTWKFDGVLQVGEYLDVDENKLKRIKQIPDSRIDKI